MARTPTSVTVLIDANEQKPLLFPRSIMYYGNCGSRSGQRVRVQTKRKRLETGDYTLVGSEPLVLIERKGSIVELVSNFLTADRARALSAFDRLSAACEVPILLLEGSPSDLWSQCSVDRVLGRGLEIERALDELCRIVVGNGLRLLWTGRCKTPTSRRHLGAFIVHLLLTYTLLETTDVDSAVTSPPSP
jgi:ERCC4-type nuclease